MLAATALALVLATPAPRCVEIAAISDLHGRVADLSRLAARVAEIRAAGPTVVLDAGDGLQGTLEARLSRGEAVVAGYAALGLDAAAVGNHDFDHGAEELRRRIAGAPYPFLAANIWVQATGRRLAWENLRARVLLRPAGGPVVGVFGVSGEDTPWVTLPDKVAGLRFGGAAREAERQASRLREEGAEIVVGVAHVGGYCTAFADPDDLSSCDPKRPLFQMARRLPAGLVDAVVGGHTHGLVNHRVNGVALVQTGARGEALGWLTLCAAQPARFHPFLRPGEGPGPPDPKVAAAVAPFVAAARAERERPVGVRLRRPLTRDRAVVSPFGAAVAQSMRAALGTEFAVVNAGALRLDLPAGELTYGQIYEAYPFDEGLAVVELRKEELEALLKVLSRKDGAVPQVAGLRWDGAEARTCAGEPLRPGGRYRVGTSQFVASGGNGARLVLRGLEPGRIAWREDVESRAALIDWLRKAPPDRLGEPCP